MKLLILFFSICWFTGFSQVSKINTDSDFTLKQSEFNLNFNVTSQTVTLFVKLTVSKIPNIKYRKEVSSTTEYKLTCYYFENKDVVKVYQFKEINKSDIFSYFHPSWDDLQK